VVPSLHTRIITLSGCLFSKESELFSRLANGQQPKVMVIGCCDSRVDPTMLMELGPGEVFTLRNVANLVPPWEKEGTYHGTSAALEFAVMGLQVSHVEHFAISFSLVHCVT
jgi:carbonic anhydrase